MYDYSRYGYISGEDGDILAYAKQASEGSFITLNKSVCIRAEHVRASISQDFNINPNSIVFGLEESDMFKLISWQPTARRNKYIHPDPLQVKFEVKHLYFNGLRAALSKLTPAGIQKMVPQSCDFVPYPLEPVMPGKPPYHELELDFYQRRALFEIINCSAGAPVLVTGPFGTGKTRLLVRAAYEILRYPCNRVLMCAHHQNSVDTFIDYFGNMAKHSCKPWRKRFVRIVLSPGYISKVKHEYLHLFKVRGKVKTIDSYDLVITTLGTSHTLLQKSHREFTHILIDEEAQTREPETISPLCFATQNTKVIIAGDHLQVCKITITN